MKLISWNVNGLRAVHRKGDWDIFLKRQKFDILCLQEIKAEKEQLPKDVAKLKDHFCYFESSKVKKGYSGVAIYSKIEPIKVEYGLGFEKFDVEGRVLIAHFDDFILYNVYFPQGGREGRLEYKLDFYDAFLEHIEKNRKKGKKIIFCGDINTAHKEIDLARPKENQKNTGFLPEEREWIDELISFGYIDSFRYFYPNKKDVYSYWDMKTHARDRNVGWRIDYFFIDPSLGSKLKQASILSDFYGSDHCPILLELELELS